MISKIVDSLPRITPFVPPEALERTAGKPFVLRLGANESPFGPSPKAVQAMQQELGSVWKYSDPTCHDLRVAIAAHLGIDPAQIVVGPGIDGILGHLARIILNPGDLAVASLGGYPTFEYAVRGTGGLLRLVPYSRQGPNLQALAEASREAGVTAVYLANPDNPSGAWQEPDAIRDFVSQVPPDVWIILDEAYSEFAPTSCVPTEFLDDRRILRLRTFSKAYGLAGMRVAYVYGAQDSVEPIDRIRMHFEVGILAQTAARAALADQAFCESVIAQNSEGREEYAAEAERLGMTTFPSATNFVCFDVGSNQRAKEMLTALAELGVFVRMPWAEPLNRCLRITVGTADQRQELWKAFACVRTL
jgi:histidinol-phosphate aminotransferase